MEKNINIYVFNITHWEAVFAMPTSQEARFYAFDTIRRLLIS